MGVFCYFRLRRQKLMPRLETIDLSHNRLDDIQRLQNLSALTRVSLRSNHIEQLHSLHTKLGNIRGLDLSGNQLRSLQGSCFSMRACIIIINSIFFFFFKLSVIFLLYNRLFICMIMLLLFLMICIMHMLCTGSDCAEKTMFLSRW